MKALTLVLALAASAAWADGVALLRPGPPLSAADQASLAKGRPGAASPIAVITNPAALDTTVVTVELGGKTYRFVGAKHELPPALTIDHSTNPPRIVKGQAPGGVAWEGKTAEGDRAYLSLSDRGLAGIFSAGGKSYVLTPGAGRAILAEAAPGRHRLIEEPTPQMIEAARLSAAQRTGAAK